MLKPRQDQFVDSQETFIWKYVSRLRVGAIVEKWSDEYKIVVIQKQSPFICLTLLNKKLNKKEFLFFPYELISRKIDEFLMDHNYERTYELL